MPLKNKLLPTLDVSVSGFSPEFLEISKNRKKLLSYVALYIQNKVRDKEEIKLVFICTHNSRRSHMGQLWAQAASVYFGIPNVMCFSGGTEATAFNSRPVRALQKAGFEITAIDKKENTLYEVIYSTQKEPITAFSKKFSHKENPQEGFAAIMTCSDADEACPFVPGADARFSIQYEDPKIADDTEQEEKVYDERCRQIANEMFYLFSKVKPE